jgi:hypothetical protein
MELIKKKEEGMVFFQAFQVLLGNESSLLPFFHAEEKSVKRRSILANVKTKKRVKQQKQTLVRRNVLASRCLLWYLSL